MTGILTVPLRAWKSIVLCTALGALAGVAYVAVTSRVYVAHSFVAIINSRPVPTLELSVADGEEGADVQSAILTNPQSALQGNATVFAAYLAARRQTLVSLVQNQEVAEAVLARLGTDATEEERRPGALTWKVQGALAVRPGSEKDKSDLVQISVVDADPERAARIADAWASEFTRIVNRTYAPQAGREAALAAELARLRGDAAAAQEELAAFLGRSDLEEATRERDELAALAVALRRARAEGDATERSPLAERIGEVERELRRLASSIEAERARKAALEGRRERAVAQVRLLEGRMEQLRLEEALWAGDVRVAARAPAPTTPVAPIPVRDVPLAMLAGLLVGVAWAHVRVAVRHALHGGYVDLGAASGSGSARAPQGVRAPMCGADV